MCLIIFVFEHKDTTFAGQKQKFDAFIEEIEVQMARIRSIIDAFNGEISGYSNMYGGNTYNTSNTSYTIQSDNAQDTVEQIKRYETVKRLAGIA